MAEPIESESSKDPREPKGFRVWLPLVLLVGILLLEIVGGMLPIWLYPNMAERGQFGDMFGWLNALFSGLAFAGVIYAILLQREELALQRRELKETRTELQRTADAQVKSEEALRKQAEALALTAQLNSLALIPSLTLQFERIEPPIQEPSKPRSSFWGALPDLPSKDPLPTVSLANLGNLPAYDIDLLAIAEYDAEQTSQEAFVSTHVKNGANWFFQATKLGRTYRDSEKFIIRSLWRI